jgi:hypothetical protein
MLEINVAHGVARKSERKSLPGRKAMLRNHNVKQEEIHMFDLNVNFLGL